MRLLDSGTRMRNAQSTRVILTSVRRNHFSSLSTYKQTLAPDLARIFHYYMVASPRAICAANS